MNKIHIFLATVAIITSCSVKKEKTDSLPVATADSTEIQITNESQPSTPVQPPKQVTRIEELCSEQIDGPANIRSAPNGKLMFELFDKVPVETTPIENDWLMVSAYIQIDSTELKSGFILPNKKLKNIEGEIIGNSFDTLELVYYDKQGGTIEGHTYKNNIRPHCSPEAQLNELIISNKLSFEEQREYREQFGFLPFDINSVEGVDEYIIYQSSIIDPSPRDRISLMYYKNKLFAFVHYRDFDFYNLESGELIRGHKIVFLTDKNQMLAQEIVENRIYLYNHSD